MFGIKREKRALLTEVAGIGFRNPLGIAMSPEKVRDIVPGCFKAGFLSLTPPSNQVLEWISILKEIRHKTVLAVNLNPPFFLPGLRFCRHHNPGSRSRKRHRLPQFLRYQRAAGRGSEYPSLLREIYPRIPAPFAGIHPGRTASDAFQRPSFRNGRHSRGHPLAPENHPR